MVQKLEVKSKNGLSGKNKESLKLHSSFYVVRLLFVKKQNPGFMKWGSRKRVRERKRKVFWAEKKS